MISRTFTTISKPVLLCLLLLATLSSQTIAQDKGKITGKVVDSNSGETLIGVNVVIQNTTRGTSTDIDGNYTLSNLDSGSYNLVFSYVSYAKKIVEGIEVKPGETTKIEISLSPDTEQLEEVVVSARSVENNEAALLAKRQKSVSFSDAISAETISQTGAGDAAAAMKKVVGASVREGKYVYVRGLGDRYTGAQLNGADLPSADPNQKSFQMDLFPSNLLDNITTIKTFTPDKPGDFTGGLVDVKTKDFPDSFTFQASASTTINSNSSFEDILLSQTSGTDFLGFDNGRRDMPDEIERFVGNPFDELEIPEINQVSDLSSEDAQLLDQLSQQFNNEMGPTQEAVPVNQSFSASIGDLLQIGGRDFGYSASVSYKQSYEFYDDGRNGRWVQVGSADQTDILTSNLELDDTKGSQNVDIGGLLNMSYRLADDHRIGTTIMRTQSGSNEGRFLTGTFQDELNQNTTFQSRTIHYTERSLTSVQLKGKSFFEKLGATTVNWSGSYAKNTQEEPDFRLFPNQINDLSNIGLGEVFQIPSNNVSFLPSRFFRDLNEDKFEASVDVKIPFKTHTNQNGTFKWGGLINHVERDFRESRLEFEPPRASVFSLNDVEGDPNAFFDVRGIIEDEEGNLQRGSVIRDATSVRNNYDAEQDHFALYGMINMPLTEKLKVVGGIRFESMEKEITSFDPEQPGGKLDDNDILPAANLIYALKNNMNARFSFSQTLARPTFRELAPFIDFNFFGDFLFQGNEDLNRTLITNYDVRWEWFLNPGEVLAVSGFYKNFDDPLERVILIERGDDVASIQNVDKAEVYGVEFELRKRLDFVEALRNFTFSTNFSLVSSEVDIPRSELIEIFDIQATRLTEVQVDSIIASKPGDQKVRDFVGQSPFTFNLDMAYQNPSIGLQAAINYNIFGDRLATVQQGKTPDNFERSYGSLNFVSSKAVGQNFTIKFSAENLIDPQIESTQRFKGTDFPVQTFSLGRSFSFGVSYAL